MFSVTTDDITNYIRTESARMSNPAIAHELKMREEKQSEYERRVVVGLTPFTVPQMEAVTEHLSTINTAEIKTVMGRQFYNSAAMKAALYAIDSVLYTPVGASANDKVTRRIREYFHHLHRIGAPSAEGLAFLGTFGPGGGTTPLASGASSGPSADSFVLKMPQPGAPNNLAHELLIGFLCLNQLRDQCPNFAYILGALNCNSAYMLAGKTANEDAVASKIPATWCTDKEAAVSQVLYENIAPSVSYEEYLGTATPAEALNIFLQALYALRTANLACDFSHGDAHANNLLVRDVSQAIRGPFNIAYTTERGQEKLLGTMVATWIDYGFSHVRFTTSDGEMSHLGKYGFENIGMDAAHSNVLADAYKLLCFSLLATQVRGRKDIFDELSKILYYFNQKESATEVVARQRRFYYALPPVSPGTLSLDGLLTYTHTVVDTSFLSPSSAPTPYPYLMCTNGCLSFRDSITLFGLTTKPAPHTFSELYDLTQLYTRRGRDLSTITFDYPRALEDEKVGIDRLVRSIEETQAQIGIVDLAVYSERDILNPTTLQLLRNMYGLIASVGDTLWLLTVQRDIINYVCDLYRDEKSKAYFAPFVARGEALGNLAELRRYIVRNTKVLDQLVARPDALRTITSDPRLVWYTTHIPPRV